MGKTDDGGAAFPGPFTGHCGNDSHADPCSCYADSGMTLRDFFAAKALVGVQTAVVEMAKSGRVDVSLSSESAMAESAYRIADAMIVARKAKQEAT